jgi:hypothetical protein
VHIFYVLKGVLGFLNKTFLTYIKYIYILKNTYMLPKAFIPNFSSLNLVDLVHSLDLDAISEVVLSCILFMYKGFAVLFNKL